MYAEQRSTMNLRWFSVACLVTVALGCDLVPDGATFPKSPGDNYYKLIINGDIERYAPEQRYVVTLVGSRTHQRLQTFTKFKIVADPLNPAAPRSPNGQGQFQLFADSLTTFDDNCTNSVVQVDEIAKTEVQVMWRAPPSGAGCVLLKAMVYEYDGHWYAADGQLTKQICEDTSIYASECCACDDAKYKVVFEGLWSAQTHPKNFPVRALWLTHFSDVIGATHPSNFSFWGEGKIATDGFRSLAEWGSVGLLERELRQYGGLLRSIVKAQGLWYPRVNSNTSTTFTVDRRRHLLSLASMFGPSPDWVVGVNGLDLCQRDCTWVESKTIDLLPYDAGTDSGISYMSPNVETIPHEKMYRITNMYPEDPRAPFYNPSKEEIPPLARLYITRENLITKPCDEKTLLTLVAEEAENSQSLDRPECNVTSWGPWSECSVSCGKGLRMRNRQYHMPLKAQEFSCDRQLVSKEMCVAAVPECEGENTNDNEAVNEPENLTPVEDTQGVCETTAWSAWSECSVTCGIGISTRRRHFLNQMGVKKCPLVSIEENRKCMEPQCPEAETDISDPACPTTMWSGWSTCSASCGRGVMFRTRLLLVPPEQQQDCSAKVETSQQRPCQEQADCIIDMPTAKRICMSETDQGPCRGLYRRWTFAASKGTCVPFSYGGCRGNRNNFLTREDCMDTCKVVLGAAAVPSTETSTQGASGSGAGNSNQPQPAVVSDSVDCKVSRWGPWSECDASCGRGHQQRTRTILRQPGPGGAPCPRMMVFRRQCTGYNCPTRN